MSTQGSHNFSRKWITTSVCLLAVYLSFFHLCIGQSGKACIIAGIVCWCVWLAICWTRSSIFSNRFEHLIHQAVGLDILLEGFNPLHEGYGFYLCAIAFWTVLFSYHWAIRSPIVQTTDVSAADQV